MNSNALKTKLLVIEGVILKTIKSCSTCEFNFGNVCAGYGTRNDNGEYTYGMSIEETSKMFPNGCEDYGISLYAYIETEDSN